MKRILLKNCNNIRMHSSKLPVLYQELEWIKSGDTNSWVDTEYTFTTNSQKRIFEVYGEGAIKFGSESTAGKSPWLSVSGSYYKLEVGFTSSPLTIPIPTELEEITVESYPNSTITLQDSDEAYYDGSITTGLSEYIFGRHTSAGIATGGAVYTSGRVKFYDDGILSCDLIPAKRKTDEKLGMYDLVAGVFRPGVGNFEEGPAVEEHLMLPESETIRLESLLVIDCPVVDCIGTALEIHKNISPNPTYLYLPQQYTQLDYIEAAGDTSRIDTGISMALETKVLVDAWFPFVSGGYWISGVSGTNKDLFSLKPYSSISALSIVNNLSAGGEFTMSIPGRYTVEFNGDGVVLDGTSVVENLGRGAYRPDVSLIVGSDTAAITGTKYYHVSIYDGTTQLKDLVPAKENSTGKIGMYDLVANIFYAGLGNGYTEGPETQSTLYCNNLTSLNLSWENTNPQAAKGDVVDFLLNLKNNKLWGGILNRNYTSIDPNTYDVISGRPNISGTLCIIGGFYEDKLNDLTVTGTQTLSNGWTEKTISNFGTLKLQYDPDETWIRLEEFDPVVRNVCLTTWNTNNDEGLSKREAKNVINLNPLKGNTELQHFDELNTYWTGLKTLDLSGCTSFGDGKLILTNLDLLETINLRGTNVEEIELSTTGNNIESITYGKNTTKINLNNKTNLTDVTIEDNTNLNVVFIDGCTQLKELYV